MLNVPRVRRDLLAVTIRQAYEELSRPAFTTWVFMHVMEDDELIGREAFSVHLGYSSARHGYIIQELRLKQYIDVIPDAVRANGPGRGLTRFALKKICLLKGFDRFIKMSNSRDNIDRRCSDCPLVIEAPPMAEKLPEHVKNHHGAPTCNKSPSLPGENASIPTNEGDING